MQLIKWPFDDRGSLMMLQAQISLFSSNTQMFVFNHTLTNITDGF